MRAALTPDAMVDAAARAGHTTPDLTRPFRHVCLGCGDGRGVVEVAMAYPHATVCAWDWRSSAVAATRHRCDAAGVTNVDLQERRGAPLALAPDAPLADFVVIDGVLERVHDEMRSAIATGVTSSLRPGGLLSVGYATTVGWIEIAPVVAIMRRIALGHQGEPDTVVPRVLAILHQLRANGAGYLVHRSRVRAWLDELFVSPHDVIHDTWLADDFRPVSHSFVCDTFPGFLHVADADDGSIELSQELRALVDSAPSRRARVALSDLCRRPRHRVDTFLAGWPT